MLQVNGLTVDMDGDLCLNGERLSEAVETGEAIERFLQYVREQVEAHPAGTKAVLVAHNGNRLDNKVMRYHLHK